MKDFILFIPGILAALTLHEYAHGWMALKLGDTTARDMGRLTLNPLAHLDPIGTILLFLVHFGWAKPVPVNMNNFDNPRRDMIWVALAGPGSNLIFAAVAGAAMFFLGGAGLIYPGQPVFAMFSFTVFVNLMLAFFNLFPIPPLDGSRVVMGLLPAQYVDGWVAFERYGFIVLLGIMLLGNVTGVSIFGATIFPLSNAMYNVFTGGAPLAF